MTRHIWILVAAFGAAPTPSAAQGLDSVRAHELAVGMAEDIRSVERLSDLRSISRTLPAIEAFFGIELELPANQEVARESTAGHLDVIYREHGTRALLEEAARLDEEGGRGWWKPLALEKIARREGPRVALEAARERDLLESGFSQLLNGAGLRRVDEVLTWIADSQLEPDLRLRLRARTLRFGSTYEPYRFWQRADSLPEPYRTQVRVRALTSNASADTVPVEVLETELQSVLQVAETLGPAESRAAVRAVARACGRRPIEPCDDFDLPIDPPSWAGVDAIRLTGSGAFAQATRRLEQLRRTQPPLVVARYMAQALELLGTNCVMRNCDLVRIDSLTTEWVGEILSVEADAIAGRIERTATWNGGDDLTELQRALGEYLSARDLDAVRELLGRMQDAGAIARVLGSLIQTAPAVDLVGAVEIYLDHVPDGAEPVRVHYSDLIRAGRRDLAEEMLERASPTAATRALVDWVQRTAHAGRVEEARRALRTLMSKSSYRYPVGEGRLLNILQSLRMLNEYLVHVRTLPTPIQRLNGIHPLIAAWVRIAAAEASGG